MTSAPAGIPREAGRPRPGRGASPLSLRYLPPQLDDEPAYRNDPLMSWSHKPEAPPPLRLGNRPWPPPPGGPARKAST